MSMKSTTSRDRFGRVLLRALVERGEYLSGSRIDWPQFSKDLGAAKGIGYETLRKAVAGERWPSVKLMETVADFLGLEPDVFGEYRLARAREALDPDAQGGGDEGYARALGNLDRLARRRSPAAR